MINHVFFLAYEEPAVERRFGEEYRRYKAERPPLDPRAVRLTLKDGPGSSVDRAAAF